MKQVSIILTVFVISALAAQTGRAAIVVNAVEVNGDVVFSGSGSLTFDGWNELNGSFSDIGSVNPGSARVGVATPIASPTPADFYRGLADGPDDFGPGNVTLADSHTGDIFGIQTRTTIIVPRDYLPGTFLEGSMTIESATFASLQMTPGTYVWTWGSLGQEDSFTLNIVPEPTSLALLGLGGLIVSRRRCSQGSR